jgi:small subunit ribosomal protein S4
MRKVRKYGETFAMAADRSTAAKYVKNHHKQPPGMHGATRIFKKHTGYGLQLQEKQKAKIFYHINEKQLRRYYAEAIRATGSASDNLLRLLEIRFDNVIYRAGFATSHPQARQLIAHGQFQLNGKSVNIPSIQVKSGDVITCASKQKLRDIITSIATNNSAVSWLKVDPNKLEISVTELPTREEIEAPFIEQLIIEFYSR